MPVFRKLFLLSLGLCGQVAIAANCGTYKGTPALSSKDIALPASKSLAVLHAHSVAGLFSLSDKKLLLLRRSVSGAESRSGNVRLALRPRDMDGNLNIHIGDQTFTELADASLFNALNIDTVIAVQREVCEDARRCDDFLPASEEVPFMINELLQCNQNGKALYAFTDGLLMTDMQLVPDKIPVGSALFFTRTANGYRLAGLIMQR